MRLIDADNLKKRAKEALKKIPHGNFAENVINGFIDEINNEPTSYDVDKVIEKLENKISMAQKIIVKQPHDELDRIANDTAESFISAYNECIEIIKGGGINE